MGATDPGDYRTDSGHITNGEWEDIKSSMPKELAAALPQRYSAQRPPNQARKSSLPNMAAVSAALG